MEGMKNGETGGRRKKEINWPGPREEEVAGEEGGGRRREEEDGGARGGRRRAALGRAHIRLPFIGDGVTSRADLQLEIHTEASDVRRL